ncbi:MAG: DUF533 domain-containing protein [Bdellovibrionales bacterium]|jgi:uncharacterized membrane protein YebE (DUF533 family)|nr:DUF533 domain-containing protein [Bdellovibrionales bacterium]
MKSLSESQLNVLRTLVALAHVDGKACEAERSFIREKLNKLKASPEQIALIRGDLETPRAPDEFFARITDLHERARLLYLARLLFFKDAEFCDYEKMVMDRFEKEHMSKVDLAAAIVKIEEIEKKIRAQEREAPSSVKGSLVFRLFQEAFRDFLYD